MSDARKVALRGALALCAAALLTGCAGGLEKLRGATALSSLPLPASGASLSFTPARYTVQDGQRYGVEVVGVRLSDGLCSRPTLGDFRKEV